MRRVIDENIIKKATEEYPTPFYVYDESSIRSAAQKIKEAFKWNKGFRNYFAVKALPNPKILEILLSEGMGLDCSSYTELLLAERIGAKGSDVMFSSNDTPAADFKKAHELDAIINLDDISHIDFLEKEAGLPDLLCFRYNPGDQVHGNEIIGQPEEAKFGMTKQQIIDGIKQAQQKGVKRFGLHAMVISNNLDKSVALEIVKALFDLAKEIYETNNIELEFINLGGGIGIPYKLEEKEFDIDGFSQEVEELLRTYLPYEPAVFMECGRYITGPHGYLVTKVRHIKHTYKTFIGLDASMHNLMRPGMYGAYHQITILGKGGSGTNSYDLTGSLCENNDKFAIDRKLPEIEVGDVVIIHDAGAHGHTMGFNYNGMLRSAELLLRPDNTVELIRRTETPDDYFATLKF
ncbi:MAG TPA: diaminopimelate decarboxylase [Candidatus Saccharimonadales bacterium]|nr:diaminopimelate decarboxylase [Candidatus Saccharimonadales bacterium]